MKKDSVSVFLPVRKGSERIPGKNTKMFANFQGGLLELKIRQLIDSKYVDEIVVSSNDDACIDVAEKFMKLCSKIVIDERPNHLAQSDTNLIDLVKYAPKVCSQQHILWTHVTSPFLDSEFYSKVVSKYREVLKSGHDSLMTARLLRSFLWDKEENKVMNKHNNIKWPRTQDLRVFYEIDSGVFFASKSVYEQLEDRIGTRPYILETDIIQGVDIDFPEDFELAQRLFLKLYDTNNV